MVKFDGAKFARYLKYDEMVALLQEVAADHPNLTKLYSIGQTHEGRDLWMMEVTNRLAGDPNHKPGFYIDGNIHAGEVTGSAVCLYTIGYLTSLYGDDRWVTELVDRVTFYILPRISADGAELFLTTPHVLRSSTRLYPGDESEGGVTPGDVDADGHILQMRIEDPDGEWKVYHKDPRLMVRRRPDDTEGKFYTILPEGIVEDYDGVEIKFKPSKWGLDINRNFPAHWEPEAVQRGAGPFPLSEPETKAVADFLVAHPNIGGVMAYHTTAGAILRPLCTGDDGKMNPKDLAAYRAIGELGEELTGYPCISVYEGFTSGAPLKGVFMDWVYEHLGAIVYSTELWDAAARAGMPRVFGKAARRTDEDGYKLLQWNDRELAGKGFEPWRPFDHPQLGPVEIGGWRSKFVLVNPPEPFLEGECRKNMLFTLKHAAALPQLEILELRAEAVASQLYKITAVVTNRGYLPSNITEMAKTIKKAKPVVAELSLAEGARLVHGKAREELGHLEGRLSLGGYSPPNPRKKKVEWLVQAPSGTRVSLAVSSPRAGRASAEVVL
ncbi:MAG: M14 family metallopeptidase [Bacillota bacterium]